MPLLVACAGKEKKILARASLPPLFAGGIVSFCGCASHLSLFWSFLVPVSPIC